MLCCKLGWKRNRPNKIAIRYRLLSISKVPTPVNYTILCFKFWFALVRPTLLGTQYISAYTGIIVTRKYCEGGEIVFHSGFSGRVVLSKRLKMSSLLSDCEVLKSKANGLMKEGAYGEAIESYTKVIDVLSSSIDASVSTDASDSTVFDAQFSVYVSCLNNLSMAYLKLDQLDDCIRICDRAIDIDANNLKAYYRRGSAYKTQAAVYDRLPGNGGKEMNAEEELLWKHAGEYSFSLLLLRYYR